MPVEPIEILWSPAGTRMPDLGAKALVDVTDGDTPNFRMPIRMLSIDTPEVTAQSVEGAQRVDGRLLELAGWIRDGKAKVSRAFADHILPRLETGKAGTLQFTQGQAASAWSKANIESRLTRPGQPDKRKLFIWMADAPFDQNKRLLAYVAPSYSAGELAAMSRRERSTFNLDLLRSGWAAPFVLYPSLPGELDMPLYLEAAFAAMDNASGQYGDPLSLPGFEYRMCEKLHAITRKLLAGETMKEHERLEWRSRYAADMRTRKLYGPENYMAVPAPYRIWIWPDDVRKAVADLNLVPAADLLAVA